MPEVAAISDTAVKQATGRGWKGWFALLDRWGAKRKDHRTIAAHLRQDHGCPSWWAQMVTVQYERVRGLRDVHEQSDGYAVNVSRTIAGSRTRVFDAFTKPTHVTKWFARGHRARLVTGGRYENDEGDCGTYRAIRRPDLVRFTWDNPKHSPGTRVEVHFVDRPGGKTVVQLQHSKLADRKAHASMREGWSWALDSFRSYVETGQPVRHEDWLAARKVRPEKPRTRRRASG